MLLTGLAMSPGMDAAFPFLLDVLGGRQTARTIHFISGELDRDLRRGASHHGAGSRASGTISRSMITGRYVIEPAEEKP